MKIKKLIESTASRKKIIQEVFMDDLESDMEQKRDNRASRCISRYIGLNPKTHTAFFKTRDPQGSGKEWEQHVRFPDFTQIGRYSKDFEGTEEKIALAIKAGEVEVWCSDPDYSMGGHQYMNYANGAGIRKEVRYPDRNNPTLEGSVCKHLSSVFKDIDKFIPEIAEDWDSAKYRDYRVIKRD